MNKTLTNAWFEEITHLVCGADKKVTVADLSDKWDIPQRASEIILVDWVDANKNQSLSKEFLVRGTDDNGHAFIMILDEKKLEEAMKRFGKFCYFLYSVELAGKSDADSLIVSKLNDCKL